MTSLSTKLRLVIGVPPAVVRGAFVPKVNGTGKLLTSGKSAEPVVGVNGVATTLLLPRALSTSSIRRVPVTICAGAVAEGVGVGVSVAEGVGNGKPDGNAVGKGVGNGNADGNADGTKPPGKRSFEGAVPLPLPHPPRNANIAATGRVGARSRKERAVNAFLQTKKERGITGKQSFLYTTIKQMLVGVFSIPADCVKMEGQAKKLALRATLKS